MVTLWITTWKVFVNLPMWLSLMYTNMYALVQLLVAAVSYILIRVYRKIHVHTYKYTYTHAHA